MDVKKVSNGLQILKSAPGL